MNKNNQDVQNEISLQGRHYLNTTDLSRNEILFLLSTVAEIKNKKLSDSQQFNGRNVTFYGEICPHIQTSLFNATNILKMHLHQLGTCHFFNNYTHKNFEDFGRILSSETDMIFCKIHKHRMTEAFARRSSVPVINTGSFRCILLQILSDVFTLQEHFHKIDGLTIAWIGKCCPFLNTYLTIVPRLGIHFRYLCNCDGPASPSELNSALIRHPEIANRVVECHTLEDVLENADAIVKAADSKKNHGLKLKQINKYCNKNWVYMPVLPRNSMDAEDEVFYHSRNIIWNSYGNLKWLCCAIITKFLPLLKIA